MWAICVYYSRTISMADRKWENRRQVKVGHDGVDRCLMNVRQKLGRTESRLIMTVQMEGMFTEALGSLYR